MARNEQLYLQDIVTATIAIASYISDVSYAEFIEDEIRQRAVLQRLTEIGEALSAHLSPPLRNRMPEIEWQDAVSFRNFAVHSYFSIDWNIVWATAVHDAPKLNRVVSRYLQVQEKD